MTERNFVFDSQLIVGDEQRFDTEHSFEHTQEFEAEFDSANGGSVCELYKGKCVVTPKVDEQIFTTANKHMPNDLTIKAIPITSVTNDTGGVTVHIG